MQLLKVSGDLSSILAAATLTGTSEHLTMAGFSGNVALASPTNSNSTLVLKAMSLNDAKQVNIGSALSNLNSLNYLGKFLVSFTTTTGLNLLLYDVTTGTTAK